MHIKNENYKWVRQYSYVRMNKAINEFPGA